MYKPPNKVYINMDTWEETIVLKTSFKVDAMKITFLQYTTKTASQKALFLRCDELGDNGLIPKPDGSNNRYLVAVPIDLYAPVTCIYAGKGKDEYDMTYLTQKSINQLKFKVYIDGLPALSDVDVDHPVTFEVAFYEKL